MKHEWRGTWLHEGKKPTKVAEAQPESSASAPEPTMPPTAPTSSDETIQRPRLRKLTIRNLRCIGPEPVHIDLSDIVVLVGPNNAGKSTILFAYELAMSQGSKKERLDINDFPNGKIDSHNLPQIELETVIHATIPTGAHWIKHEDNGDLVVRERWTWDRPDTPPKREGFNIETNEWDHKVVPWGAAGVANSRRPEPHRIGAFDSPEAQATEVANLLLAAIKERLKARTPVDGEHSDYGLMLSQLATLRKNIIDQERTRIEAAEKQISSYVGEIFAGYQVQFEAQHEEDLAKIFFKAGAQLKMGPTGGHPTPLDRQGSGARRTLMWSALRYIAENTTADKINRPHLLLLDEPELCLHPNAVRHACRVLYDLAEHENWQVMVTTHAPAFIDLSRDNTTIVRVSRSTSGVVQGTTVFRSERHKLAPTERRELKLLNLCDPSVNEFFFGGRTIIVEGDTEYTAFKYVMDVKESDPRYRDVHIIRARGKVMVALLARILNQFTSDYAVLHDSDQPKVTTRTKTQQNSAWLQNRLILEAVLQAKGRVRHLALVPNFEAAILAQEASAEKPYNALTLIRSDSAIFERVERLLQALLDHTIDPPAGCKKVEDAQTLINAFSVWLAHAASENAAPQANAASTQGSAATPQIGPKAQLSLVGTLFAPPTKPDSASNK